MGGGAQLWKTIDSMIQYTWSILKAKRLEWFFFFFFCRGHLRAPGICVCVGGGGGGGGGGVPSSPSPPPPPCALDSSHLFLKVSSSPHHHSYAWLLTCCCQWWWSCPRTRSLPSQTDFETSCLLSVGGRIKKFILLWNPHCPFHKKKTSCGATCTCMCT